MNNACKARFRFSTGTYVHTCIQAWGHKGPHTTKQGQFWEVYSQKCGHAWCDGEVCSAPAADRTALIRVAREALTELKPEERELLFNEFGLRESMEFVKGFKSPGAQVGALLGGIFGAALGMGAEAASKNEHAAKHASDCKGAKLGAGWCCKPIEEESRRRLSRYEPIAFGEKRCNAPFVNSPDYLGSPTDAKTDHDVLCTRQKGHEGLHHFAPWAKDFR